MIDLASVRAMWSEAVRTNLGASSGNDRRGRADPDKKATLVRQLLKLPGLSSSARNYLSELAREYPGPKLQRPQGVAGAMPRRGMRLQPIARRLPGIRGKSSRTISLGGELPVYIHPTGMPVSKPISRGKIAPDEVAEGFYRMALLVSAANQGNESIDEFKRMPLSRKKALADHALGVAWGTARNLRPWDGFTADQRIQLRSSAITTLIAMRATTERTWATEQLHASIHADLVELGRNEKNRPFAEHIARLVNHESYALGLSTIERQQAKELFADRFPQRFEVDNILDADGFISWEHITGNDENFFRSFLVRLGQRQLHGGSFRQTGVDDRGVASYELKFPKAMGRDGRVRGIRLEVREFKRDMYDGVGTRRGISYGGHSQGGQNQANSLARFMANVDRAVVDGQPRGAQIAYLDLCAGVDGLDDAFKNIPGLDVITTLGSSHFNRGTMSDEQGDFDGVTETEGDAVFEILASLAEEDGYEAMRERVSATLWAEQHGARRENVVFPTFGDYAQVRWMHLDGDRDGIADSQDLFFQVGLAAPEHSRSPDVDHANSDPKDRSSFELTDHGPAAELNGDVLHGAVSDLNVGTHYSAFFRGSPALEHRFVSNGYFDSADPRDLVRLSPSEGFDGAAAIEVSLNAKLAGADLEAIKALFAYEAVIEMAEAGVLEGLQDPVDRKLFALVFTGSLLIYDATDKKYDQRLWGELLTTLNIPAEVSFALMSAIVKAAKDDPRHDYTGNLDMAKQYAAQLPKSTIKSLRRSSVGVARAELGFLRR